MICDISQFYFQRGFIFLNFFFYFRNWIRVGSVRHVSYFITSMFKSLVISAISLALVSSMNSQIAPFYAQSRIFVSANEAALIKHNILNFFLK